MKNSKDLFGKLGFRKMDEMEKHIIFLAQRNAYIFLIIALVAWSFYESYKVYAHHTVINLMPCSLLVVACLIQTFTQLILNRNAVKDDEEFKDSNPLFKIVIFSFSIAAIIATIGAAFILTGVGR